MIDSIEVSAIGRCSLSLERGVYFVSGAVGAILYDSRKGFLYHLDHEAKMMVVEILSGKMSLHGGSISKGAVQNLLEKGLITTKTSNWKGDIRQLECGTRITFAWVEVTTACNLKCIHCYEGKTLDSKTEMSLSTFSKIVEELCVRGVKKIQLIGGEPLLSPLLRSFLDCSDGKFDYVEVYTNGTLLNQEWIEYFKQHNIRVALSVYSYDAVCHDWVTCCKGAWEKTNRAIRLLADAGVKYRVRNVLMKGVCVGEKNTDLYTLSQNRDVVRIVGRAGVDLLTPDILKKRLITKQTFRAPIPLKRVVRMVCGHNCFGSHLYFDANGIVYPCVMERRFSHGNINSAPLSELLKSEILKFNKDHITECCDCEFRYFCFDCRPDSMGSSVSDKPWYCTYRPLMGKWDDGDSFITTLRKRYGF